MNTPVNTKRNNIIIEAPTYLNTQKSFGFN